MEKQSGWSPSIGLETSLQWNATLLLSQNTIPVPAWEAHGILHTSAVKEETMCYLSLDGYPFRPYHSWLCVLTCLGGDSNPESSVQI